MVSPTRVCLGAGFVLFVPGLSSAPWHWGSPCAGPALAAFVPELTSHCDEVALKGEIRCTRINTAEAAALLARPGGVGEQAFPFGSLPASTAASCSRRYWSTRAQTAGVNLLEAFLLPADETYA